MHELLSASSSNIRDVVDRLPPTDHREIVASLLEVVHSETGYRASERAAAGTALGFLGDPRFREDAAFLPDEPLVGFVEVPAGKFLMGSESTEEGTFSFKNERPLHPVELPSYMISRFPVTVAQFGVFLETTGYQPDGKPGLGMPPNYPIVRITWHDATAYCQWLTEHLKAWQGTPEPLASLLRSGEAAVSLPSEADPRGPLSESMRARLGSGRGMTSLFPSYATCDAERSYTASDHGVNRGFKVLGASGSSERNVRPDDGRYVIIEFQDANASAD